jgi:hypothetical protein
MHELDNLDTAGNEHSARKRPDDRAFDLPAHVQAETIALYPDSLQDVLAEVDRVGSLVKLCVQRAMSLQSHPREVPGLCVYEQEIKDLVELGFRLPLWTMPQDSESDNCIAAMRDKATSEATRRKEESARRGSRLRLPELADSFQLDRLSFCSAWLRNWVCSTRSYMGTCRMT